MKNQTRFPAIGDSSEIDTSFTGAWPGTSAFCKCGAAGIGPTECSANPHYDVRNVSTEGCKEATAQMIYTDEPVKCNDTVKAAGCVDIPQVKSIVLEKLPDYWPAKLPPFDPNAFNATEDPNGTAPTAPTSPTTATPGKMLCIKRSGPKLVDLKLADAATDCASPLVKCGAICWNPKDSHAPASCPMTSWSVTSADGNVTTTYSSAAGSGQVRTCIPSPHLLLLIFFCPPSAPSFC